MKIKALYPIRHDDQMIAPGQTVELRPEHARPLVEAGMAEMVAEPKAARGGKEATQAQ
mgnify:CR=1 FL=1